MTNQRYGGLKLLLTKLSVNLSYVHMCFQIFLTTSPKGRVGDGIQNLTHVDYVYTPYIFHRLNDK